MKNAFIAAMAATASLVALPALADGKNDGEIDMPFESDATSLSNEAQDERSTSLDYGNEGDYSRKEDEGYNSTTPEFDSDSGLSAMTTGDDAAND